MFTGRFIQIPIKTYSERLKALMDEPPMQEAVARIDKSVICYYYPCEDEEQPVTNVYLTSGHSFLVYLSVEEFEKLLNKSER